MSPPFFTIPNINNLRDASLNISGLPTTNPPGKIRPGILFRSADVSKLDLEGWNAVRSIGVGHVFDLRSRPEVEKGWKVVTQTRDGGNEKGGGDGADDDVRPPWLSTMEASGVKRTWTPVFSAEDYSPERLAERYLKYMDESAEGFVMAYQDILLNAGPAFRTIFSYLTQVGPVGNGNEEGEAKGALIHCTAGKDRTGIFFGILFDYLGVERRLIADEYQLTELGLAHIREEVVARLMQSPAFKNYVMSEKEGGDATPTTAQVAELFKRVVDVPVASPTSPSGANGVSESEPEAEIPPEVLEKGRQAALRMIGAKKESMLGALEMVDREFGGSEGYLRRVVGFGDAELEMLKRNLVVGA
ncbi:hypothetical protein P154DRAFT_523647 [Amniculicola lignicola CBS 123094]|uniref:Tyrosine specific protein phosphatases domain-containing protein n=1 Tax=Amniculicola lignicola CBS 123094 TaxID=1392246 RepID=A0A6A5WAX7_9PLEO|nr:hypothetical protein P154DRAFT_523647 [Amniculicola lignicola CBS 123094]